MGPLRNANATRLLASAAKSRSNVIFRLGFGVSQTRNHTQTNGRDANRQCSQQEGPARTPQAAACLPRTLAPETSTYQPTNRILKSLRKADYACIGSVFRC